MGDFKMRRPGVKGLRPTNVIVDEVSEDYEPPEDMSVGAGFRKVNGQLELQSVSFVDKPLHPSWVVEKVGPELVLPSRPAEVQMWRLFLIGAEWGADGEYPAHDDGEYYLGEPHGRAMLTAFWQELAQMRPPTSTEAVRTMCPLGRPYRDHGAQCHHECDWRP